MALARTIAMRTHGLPRDLQLRSVRSAVDSIRAHYRESFGRQPAELAHSLDFADRLEAEALELLEQTSVSPAPAARHAAIAELS